MTTKRTLISVATVAMLALISASAFAAKPPKKVAPSSVADNKEEKVAAEAALEHHSKGNFDKAGALYAAAFEKWKRATHIFNAARCYHKGKMFVRAVQLYNQYLELADASEEGKAEARQHIAAIEAETAVTTPTKPATSKEPPTPQPADPTTTTVTITKPTPPSAPDRILTWSMIGGGSLLALAGAGGLITAEAKMTDLNGNGMDWATPNAQATYKDSVSEVKTLRTMSMVGAGIGLAAAGWGVYRFLTEPETPPSGMPTVHPTITQDGARVVLEWKR